MKNFITILALVLIMNNQDIVMVINQYRGFNHLPALQTSQTLEKTTEYRVNDMVNSNYFAHNKFSNILEIFNVNFKIAGENIAKGYDNESKLVDAWMASPKHRKQILDKRFKYIGVSNQDGITVLHLTD